jgi:hypothetical protein
MPKGSRTPCYLRGRSLNAQGDLPPCCDFMVWISGESFEHPRGFGPLVATCVAVIDVPHPFFEYPRGFGPLVTSSTRPFRPSATSDFNSQGDLVPLSRGTWTNRHRWRPSYISTPKEVSPPCHPVRRCPRESGPSHFNAQGGFPSLSPWNNPRHTSICSRFQLPRRFSSLSPGGHGREQLRWLCISTPKGSFPLVTAWPM